MLLVECVIHLITVSEAAGMLHAALLFFAALRGEPATRKQSRSLHSAYAAASLRKLSSTNQFYKCIHVITPQTDGGPTARSQHSRVPGWFRPESVVTSKDSDQLRVADR
jgi:hypothetical protein